MNTSSNVVHEPALEAYATMPIANSATRPMYWSVRRELWENRSIYIAPLAVAVLFVIGVLVRTIYLRDKIHVLSGLELALQLEIIQQTYSFAALILMATTFLVAIFYCLDALHGERRDRSILFWKSLPVSDLTTVLSKASIPLVVLPLLTFAITLATQLIMMLTSSVVLLGSGVSVASHVPLFQMTAMLLYHLVAIHALWYAPIYAYLLLVSGLARRAAFLWAILPPLAIAVAERIAFNTSHFGSILRSRLAGPEGFASAASGMPVDSMTHVTPGRFLLEPGLWIGLIFTVAFIAAAIRLRRYRGPI